MNLTLINGTGVPGRPKVAFVLPNLAAGGAERVALTLLRTVDPERFEVCLVLLEQSGPLADDYSSRIPTYVLARPRLRRAIPALLRVLNRVSPRVIFSTFGHVNVLLLAMRPLLAGKPRLLLREPNTPSMSIPRLAYGDILRFAYLCLYRHADRIVCQSRRIADELQNDFGVSRRQVDHLPNPVDLDFIRREAIPPIRPPGPGPHFVACGSLTYQKGFDRLIEWFRLVPPPATLWIIGGGPDKQMLQNMIRDRRMLDRVDLLGYIDKPWQYFAAADAFLLPSRWEGMPNVALEALACGTRVIGTPEAGGLVELADEVAGGAVCIAPEPDFVASIQRATRRTDSGLKPSLLPAAHAAENVSLQFNRILVELDVHTES